MAPSCVGGHGPRRACCGCTTMLVGDRLQQLQHALDVLVGERARRRATSRLNANSSLSARDRGPHAGRVVRGVEQDGRARCGPRSSRPGEVTPAKPVADRLDVERRVRRRRRGTPRPRRARRPRSAPGARRAAAGRARRRRRRGPAGSAPARRRRASRCSTPNSRPSRAHGRADLGAALAAIGRTPPRAAAAQISVASGLMIPAFSSGDVLDRVAEPLGVVEADRRDHGDLRRRSTLVASPAPPRPTSTTATSTGRVGERGERHRGESPRRTTAARRLRASRSSA